MTTIEQEERIAVLLSSLGGDVAGQVVANLPGDAANRVQQHMDQLKSTPIDADDIEDVLDEFFRFFRFAMQNELPAASGSDARSANAPSRKRRSPSDHRSNPPAIPTRI